MRVLITGGAGYLGTELVHALGEVGEISSLTIYDNLARKNLNLFISRPLRAAETRFVRADVLDTRKLRREVSRADVVYHLAARVTTPFGHDDPHTYEQVNHWGTAELAYAVEDSPVKRLVYVSSTSVYGASADPADLTTAPKPSTHYGWSKLRGERTLERLAGGCGVFILRCANVYGYSPSMRFDSVLNRFMFEANFSNRITIDGSGEQRRPFTHVRNVCRSLVALGLGQLPAGTYDLVDRNHSILELAEVVKSLYPELETLFIEQDLQLRNLEVLPDPRLAEHIALSPGCLADELDELRSHFAFTPTAPRLLARDRLR